MKLGHLREPQLTHEIAMLYSFDILLVLESFFNNFAIFGKGQIISECLFDDFKFPKKSTINLTNFCPETKKWSNQVKALSYNIMIIWAI